MKLSRLFVFLLFLAFPVVVSAGLIQQVATEKRMCLKKREELLAGGFYGAVLLGCKEGSSGEQGQSGGGSTGSEGKTGDGKGGTGK